MKDSITVKDFYKAKEALKKANVPTSSVFVTFGTQTNMFDFPAPTCAKKACCPKEKEDTMNYNEIEASRKYLNQRASETFYTKERDLSKQFKLDKKDRPQTYKDLIDAIKNGNYELDTKKTTSIDGYVDDEGYYFGSMLDGIVWKLPDGPDRDGFDAAYKAAKAALTAAKDVINTQDSAAGLKALQDFEAWTYSPPASA